MILFGKLRFGFVAAIALLTVCTFAGAASAGPSDTPAQKTAPKKTTHRRHKSSGKPHIATNASDTTKTSTGKRSRRKKRVRGQQKIDSERARSIQEALIRQHYLTGTATGTWNTASEEAMRRYQADHGWQSKTVPDSRALISLGLGPSKDHLLNPESAMTTGPEAPRAEPLPATSQSPAPVSSPAAPTQKDAPNPQ